MTERTKKIYHRVLLTLSAALLVGLGYYVQKNSASFEKIKSIKLSLIFLLIGIHALNYLLLGITHFYPLRKHNIFLKLKEWYGLCTVSELFNMLLPAKGGTAIRMMYINEKKGLPIREFLSMALAVVLTGFSLLGIVGTIYCHFFLQKHNLVFVALESLFIALTISSFILIFASELLTRLFKMERKYSPKKYLTDKKIVLISLFCYMGMFVLYPIKIYLSFKAIGIHIHLIDSFEISLILLASSFFQVLPGNIGVKEVATAYIAQQYGIQFETALLASLVDRAILLLFLFPFGTYFYWDLLLGASLPKINWPKTEASSRIPLMKRLVKVR
ncbi:MAG: lysylphosphatidylglycerol synthase transmembrane domain-containing protein [Bacteriovorax sp.]|nr:lysylphosphatidylglycerol synthase transmembrane domain-containing protein [Bacteriovorax sp.]